MSFLKEIAAGFNKFRVRQNKRKIQFTKFTRIKDLSGEKTAFLTEVVQSVLTDAWGSFPQHFLDRHVFKDADTIVTARNNGAHVGFSVLSHKTICEKHVHYLELCAVSTRHQNSGLGSKLVYQALFQHLKESFLRYPPAPLHLMLITPNVRIISSLSRFSSSIYPNPRAADVKGEIPPADEATFEMAQRLIKMSDNPNRSVNRDGLVLHGSYDATPWLKHGKDNIPWHCDEQMNSFASRYLNYRNYSGEEFIVSAIIKPVDVLNFLFKRRYSRNGLRHKDNRRAI
jgi:hypothetical protein